MTELLSELRRSPVAGDRAVAELLHSLRPADDSRPRASEALAAFIAERGSGVTPPAELQAPVESPNLLVVLGRSSDAKPARQRVPAGLWAQAAAVAAVALVAVAVATGGPSRDVVVRPTDSSTRAPATTTPADKADPTPRRHHPVAPSAGSRPHRARIHPAATAATASNYAPPVSTSAAASDAESAGESDDAAQPEASGDDRGEETARGSDEGGDPSDGGDTSDGGGGDERATPEGVDD